MTSETFQATNRLRWLTRYRDVGYPDPWGRIGAPGQVVRESYHTLQQAWQSRETGEIRWHDVPTESEASE